VLHPVRARIKAIWLAGMGVDMFDSPVEK